MSDASAVDQSGALVVALDGPPSLTGRLVSRVLRDAGVIVIEGAHARADVVVLIEPTREHWERARTADAGVLLLTEPAPEGDALVHAVENGARGALSVRCQRDELVAALQRVASGDIALTRGQTRQLCESLRARTHARDMIPVQLTVRELQILQSIEAGELMKQTARALGISPRTVENTQRVLFRKLGVRNRAQAMAQAYAFGLLDHDERVTHE